MRKISVSCTLTVFHDGRFWVGVVQRIDNGRLFVSRIVFGAEPSSEEIEQLILSHAWDCLRFSGERKAAACARKDAAGVVLADRRSDNGSLACAREGRRGEAGSAHDAGADGFSESAADVPPMAKNPKRRQREVRKQARRNVSSGTKAQQVLAEAREAAKDDRRRVRAVRKKTDSDARFALRQEKRKRKHKGH